ncbi:MAG TPA: hypothetical protein VJ625_17160 [Propionibacteriaceae bacterium]|nr:hypothetical protein [Propionibacteriaceae bacterium]
MNVEVHGTFLTGNPLPMVDDFVTEATWVAAGQGLAYWHQALDQSLVAPTPIYETKLMIERMSAERVVAHDQGMVYGPWLEGTSSRNQTTQFKGYKSARLATAALERRMPVVLAPYVEQLIRRLDGA